MVHTPITRKLLSNIRKLNEKLNANVCILLDLQGPKLRIGEVENNRIDLKKGAQLILTTEPCLGTSERLYISFKPCLRTFAKARKSCWTTEK